MTIIYIKSKAILTVITFLMLIFFFKPVSVLAPTGFSITSPSNTNASSIISHNEAVNFSFFRNFHFENRNNTPDFLGMNVTAGLSYINSFNASNVNVYVGNDLIPGLSLSLYYVQVTLVQADIYDDHDGIGQGAGEIFFDITINGNDSQDDNGGNYYLADSGESVYPSFVGFRGWITQLEFNIHVWEHDIALDDDLGSISYSTTTPIEGTIEETTDIGDARIFVQIEVLDSQNYITAQQLLNGYQPYISVRDETLGTELPDGVFGRVCIGEDDQLDQQGICLQYFYYWNQVTGPTGTLIRKYDYQELLLFLNTDLGAPYRVVFDAPPDIVDVLPRHEYTIWEEGGSGSYSTSVNVSENLRPYLGSTIPLKYTLKDLVQDAALRTSLLGQTTIRFTVDTYFHGFQMGEPGGIGILGTIYGYVSDIEELNDSLICNWYGHLDESLDEGIHGVGIGTQTYTVPKVTPFVFDLTDPFKRPYLINAWDNVMADLRAFERAQTIGCIYDEILDLNVTFTIPAILEINYPESLNPGEMSLTNLSIQMLDKETTMTFDYSVFFNGSFQYGFHDPSITKQQNGTMIFQTPLNNFQCLITSLGILQEGEEGEDWIIEYLNENLDESYLSLDYLTLNPELLGEILNASLRIHLWDITRDYSPAQLSLLLRVLDQVINHLDLLVQPSLEGLVRGTLSSSDLLTAEIGCSTIEFNSTTTNIAVPISVVENPAEDSFSLEFKDLRFIFQFLVNWSITLSLEEPFNNFGGPWVWDIGTYPEIEYGQEGILCANLSYLTVVIRVSTIQEFQQVSELDVFAVTLVLSVGVVFIAKRRR